MSTDEPITELLERAEGGDEAALEQAIAAIYDDLRVRARTYLARFSGGRAVTLQPTALVNETYLKLLKQNTQYANRGHFLAIATRVMMRVLIDFQRARLAEKRGGGQIAVTLSGVGTASDDPATGVLALADVLDQLEELDERKARIVKLRAIWGFDMQEIAEITEVSLSTVERDWRFARNWLATQLSV